MSELPGGVGGIAPADPPPAVGPVGQGGGAAQRRRPPRPAPAPAAPAAAQPQATPEAPPRHDGPGRLIDELA